MIGDDFVVGDGVLLLGDDLSDVASICALELSFNSSGFDSCVAAAVFSCATLRCSSKAFAVL